MDRHTRARARLALAAWTLLPFLLLRLRGRISAAVSSTSRFARPSIACPSMWRARMPPAPLKFPESRPSSPSQQTPLPPCPKQEQQLADAKERYTASKFFCNKAAKQLDDAMQQGASTEALEPHIAWP